MAATDDIMKRYYESQGRNTGYGVTANNLGQSVADTAQQAYEATYGDKPAGEVLDARQAGDETPAAAQPGAAGAAGSAVAAASGQNAGPATQVNPSYNSQPQVLGDGRNETVDSGGVVRSTVGDDYTNSYAATQGVWSQQGSGAAGTENERNINLGTQPGTAGMVIDPVTGGWVPGPDYQAAPGWGGDSLGGGGNINQGLAGFMGADEQATARGAAAVIPPGGSAGGVAPSGLPPLDLSGQTNMQGQVPGTNMTYADIMQIITGGGDLGGLGVGTPRGNNWNTGPGAPGAGAQDMRTDLAKSTAPGSSEAAAGSTNGDAQATGATQDNTTQHGAPGSTYTWKGPDGQVYESNRISDMGSTDPSLLAGQGTVGTNQGLPSADATAGTTPSAKPTNQYVADYANADMSQDLTQGIGKDWDIQMGGTGGEGTSPNDYRAQYPSTTVGEHTTNVGLAQQIHNPRLLQIAQKMRDWAERITADQGTGTMNDMSEKEFAKGMRILQEGTALLGVYGIGYDPIATLNTSGIDPGGNTNRDEGPTDIQTNYTQVDNNGGHFGRLMDRLGNDTTALERLSAWEQAVAMQERERDWDNQQGALDIQNQGRDAMSRTSNPFRAMAEDSVVGMMENPLPYDENVARNQYAANLDRTSQAGVDQRSSSAARRGVSLGSQMGTEARYNTDANNEKAYGIGQMNRDMKNEGRDRLMQSIQLAAQTDNQYRGQEQGILNNISNILTGNPSIQGSVADGAASGGANIYAIQQATDALDAQGGFGFADLLAGLGPLLGNTGMFTKKDKTKAEG